MNCFLLLFLSFHSTCSPLVLPSSYPDHHWKERKKISVCQSCSVDCGTADTEIKVPSVENSELTKILPCKSWSRSEYSHACFTHCQEFLPCPNVYLPSPFTFLANCCFVLCFKHFDTEIDWKCSSCIFVCLNSQLWWGFGFLQSVLWLWVISLYHRTCLNKCFPRSHQMAWTGPWQHLSLCVLCHEQCPGGACGLSSPRFRGPTDCLSLWHSCQTTTDHVGHWDVFTLGSTGRGLVHILCCGNVYINRYKMSHHSWLLLIIIEFHHHVQNLVHCVVSGFILFSFSVSLLQWGTADTEVKVPSVENPELTKGLPCKSWNRSEYSHACFTHCQEFLPCSNFYLPSPFTFLANCCFVLCFKHFDRKLTGSVPLAFFVCLNSQLWWGFGFLQSVLWLLGDFSVS